MVDFKLKTALFWTIILFITQTIICIGSVHIYETYTLPKYFRGDTTIGVYALPAASVLLWTALLAVLLRILPRANLKLQQKIVLPIIFTILSAIVTFLFFQNLFSQHPAIFFASWIIPVVTLFSAAISKRNYYD